jgi:hypothetical protein
MLVINAKTLVMLPYSSLRICPMPLGLGVHYDAGCKISIQLESGNVQRCITMLTNGYQLSIQHMTLCQAGLADS